MTCMLEVSCYLHSGRDIVILPWFWWSVIGICWSILPDIARLAPPLLKTPHAKEFDETSIRVTTIQCDCVRRGICEHTSIFLSLCSPVMVGPTFCFDIICVFMTFADHYKNLFCRSSQESVLQIITGVWTLAWHLLCRDAVVMQGAQFWPPDGILLLENILSFKWICPSPRFL